MFATFVGLISISNTHMFREVEVSVLFSLHCLATQTNSWINTGHVRNRGRSGEGSSDKKHLQTVLICSVILVGNFQALLLA